MKLGVVSRKKFEEEVRPELLCFSTQAIALWENDEFWALVQDKVFQVWVPCNQGEDMAPVKNVERRNSMFKVLQFWIDTEKYALEFVWIPELTPVYYF